jgi:hypothetical protein
MKEDEIAEYDKRYEELRNKLLEDKYAKFAEPSGENNAEE